MDSNGITWMMLFQVLMTCCVVFAVISVSLRLVDIDDTLSKMEMHQRVETIAAVDCVLAR
jgi:hypothetical protein